MNFDGLILVADDELTIRKLAEHALKRMGFQVVLARDGAEAVEAAKNPRVKLIIMDATMPRLNGFEASKQIKESNPDLPIIMLTAAYSNTPLKYRKKGNEVIDYFMRKPFDIKDLTFHIKRLLDIE